MPQVPITEDVTLWCQDLGEGPAVVLIHGGCMSHRVWESQIYALLESGYRVIAPDLRGHGNSDKPVSSYTANMYVPWDPIETQHKRPLWRVFIGHVGR